MSPALWGKRHIVSVFQGQRVACWLVLLVASFAPALACAQFTSERMYHLSIPAHIELPAISPAEIMAGAASQGVATPEQLQQGGLPVRGMISRLLQDMWQMRVPAEQAAAAMRVSYTLRAANGQLNHLSHLEQPHAVMRVVVQPQPALPIARTARGVMLMQGGGVWQLFPLSVRYSGIYTGTLTITVEMP